MLENIVFTLLMIIAVAAGIWVWWRESHGELPQPPLQSQEEGEENYE